MKHKVTEATLVALQCASILMKSDREWRFIPALQSLTLHCKRNHFQIIIFLILELHLILRVKHFFFVHVVCGFGALNNLLRNL